MKFRLPNKFNRTPEQMLRNAGYFYIFDKLSQQGSFIKELTTQRYPRFHLYITETPKEVIFDLHLDQSATRYKGQSAHNADYDSSQVKAELTKIAHIIAACRI
jgi:hypothetical protein